MPAQDYDKLIPTYKPFLKWAGGKRQLLPEINRLIPASILKVDKFTYIEPFIGSGAMLFHILRNFRKKVKQAVISDINHDLIKAYTTIRDSPEPLLAQLEKISLRYYSYASEADRKKYFLEERDKFNTKPDDPILNSSLLIFLNRTCYNGLFRVNSSGSFNVPFGKYKKPTIYNPELIKAVSAGLQDVIILWGDYQQTLHYAEEPTLFYFDPPYKPITKSSSFTAYSMTSFNDAGQIRLKEFCDDITRAGHAFILSNSDVKNYEPGNLFFDKLYEDYHVERVKAKRNINSKGSERGEISELLITNQK